MSNMFDAFKMIGKLGEIKDQMKEVKERLKFVGIEHESEDGLIKVYVNAVKDVKKIEINENMLNPAAKADLEQKLVETLNQALQKADEKGKAETKEALKGSLPDIPGLDPDNLPI